MFKIHGNKRAKRIISTRHIIITFSHARAISVSGAGISSFREMCFWYQHASWIFNHLSLLQKPCDNPLDVNHHVTILTHTPNIHRQLPQTAHINWQQSIDCVNQSELEISYFAHAQLSNSHEPWCKFHLIYVKYYRFNRVSCVDRFSPRRTNFNRSSFVTCIDRAFIERY